ncbi:hypothetical protein ACWGHM_36720 [Streptomyces sp. NPDC054904]|uniref:hypothetical protein n=1 Tax=Streptomyces sp. NPDC090054 TaxID=3365933 RepID=UPI003801EA3D
MLVLDPQTRTVWRAYDNALLHSEGWTVRQLAPADALEQLGDIVDPIQDRQDDLTEYVERSGNIDSDQAALDEYAAVVLLSLPAEPKVAAARGPSRNGPGNRCWCQKF